MNVRELILELSHFEPEMFVYIPDIDGTLQIAKAVMPLCHISSPIDGVHIPPDVVILPLSFLVQEQAQTPEAII